MGQGKKKSEFQGTFEKFKSKKKKGEKKNKEKPWQRKNRNEE